MKQKTNRLYGGLAAGVLALGLTFAVAPAAQAMPDGCIASWGSDGRAYGNCSSGTGQYRLGVPCKTFFTAFFAYSGWESPGTPTSVGCPFGSWVWQDIVGGPHIAIEKHS